MNVNAAADVNSPDLQHDEFALVFTSATRKKSPNVCKSCPKLISLENDRFLTPLQKLPKNVGDLGKSMVDKGLKKLPKVQ